MLEVKVQHLIMSATKTKKPIDMLRKLIRIHTNKNDTVLDTFAGSFTTGLACHLENRNCIASEIDTNMFNNAETRFINFKSQLNIF